jgi:rubrerythrin
MTASLSRRQFMTLAGGSAVAASALLAACGGGGSSIDTSEFGDGDVGVLNFALTLEHLEVAFYAALIKADALSGVAEKTLGKFGEEEQEHVASLTKAIENLGGKPAPRPKTAFSIGNESEALGIGSELENAGAAAYLGQLPKVQSEATMGTLLSIHSVEGRHAAAINSLLGKPVTPNGAFAKPAAAKATLAAMEPFIVS